MLYLVSGASRAGKTMIAQRILQQRRIPYMSLDWLVMGFTEGLPQYGLHDKLMPDEIAEKLWGFLRPICENMTWSGIDYVIEGEAVLPGLIQVLLDDHPDGIEICFMGYTDIDIEQKLMDIRKYSIGKGDWLVKEDDDYILRHIENMIGHSRMIKEGCEKYDMRYIDTSVDFLAAVEDATGYLLR
ncbi:hypothetical protein H8E07_20875 [bacterium]|nr:hypothetical protein [bacterium]